MVNEPKFALVVPLAVWIAGGIEVVVVDVDVVEVDVVEVEVVDVLVVRAQVTVIPIPPRPHPIPSVGVHPESH